MAAKPERAPRMRETLRASERRETSMAEAAAEPGGSPGPAAAPSPRGSAGPQEDERCPGGASAESGGAAPDPDSAADSEAVPNPPLRKGTPSSSGRRSRAAGSPGSLRLSPALGSPQGRRRSWRRCSLKGRRSRRKSLPPVHHEVSALSRSISLELPEVQRLSLLLLSSFQFSARQLRRRLQQSPGFDPELFSAQVQRGSEEFQRLLQRLLQDGTLGNCLEATPGDSLDPALEESVAQVKLLMARLSGELQAWDQLLQQHLQRAQLASRSLQQLRSGSPLPLPPQSQILSSRPDYGLLLARHGPALRRLRLLVDEAQQAGKMVLEFHRQSSAFLRDLSAQLASRTFRGLPGSPARRLLQKRPQKALPADGE
ncbi:kinetochore-associated protein DSN1 homolog isoform X2 [Motacilla alba alba]|uniref:kinetochore-associated protein DSN1 homolog isoform X2 n=1 Tax=Motacilla alba alba TaxID=1094192 RepID=UPI0018D50496|nr:kinetochore-associated protein DSN1 homolog isoform X2 [Motacilla alba alba]